LSHFLLFFFSSRRRHTRFSRDWSSDVCSSDLMRMHVYVLRRFLATIPTLFLMLTFVFFLVRVVPGDPAIAILGDSASQDALERFREQMGLKDPLHVQYFRFLADKIGRASCRERV